MYLSLKERKKNYYSNLDSSCTSDNKRLCTYLFWNMVKPLFTDKVRTMEQITLIENDEFIYKDKKVQKMGPLVKCLLRKASI